MISSAVTLPRRRPARTDHLRNLIERRFIVAQRCGMVEFLTGPLCIELRAPSAARSLFEREATLELRTLFLRCDDFDGDPACDQVSQVRCTGP